MKKTKEPEMFTDAESEIYFCAFRYCLGRMTYVVDDFCREATAKIRRINTNDLRLMEKEITEAEEHDKREFGKDIFYKQLGMDCDREDWLSFREAIRNELKRRENDNENH